MNNHLAEIATGEHFQPSLGHILDSMLHGLMRLKKEEEEEE